VTRTFRFDPEADRAVDLAIGSRIVIPQPSGRVKLTDVGVQLADAILDSDLMLVEKSFLETLPTSVAEAEIRRRLGWDER
jgi:hypothetical protein